MNPIRVAVIGAGHLGKIHARLTNANPRFELVAVVDPLESVHAQIADQVDAKTVSHHRFIGDNIDAAIIATPTESHYDIAAELIRAGKHVLVEKPLTLNVEQSRSLVQLGYENNVTLQVGHVERFNAAWQAICSAVGDVRYVEANRTSGFTFRSIDVGAVFDLMIHDIDLALSSIGGEVTQLDCTGMSLLGRNEDMAQARIQFDNGAVANLTASRCSFEASRTIQLIGSKGYASANLTTGAAKLITVPDELLTRELDVYQWPREQQLALKDTMFSDLMPVKELQIEPVNAIQQEHDDFAECIKTSATPRVCGIAGARAVEVAQQIVTNINQHTWKVDGQQFTGSLCTWATPAKKRAA